MSYTVQGSTLPVLVAQFPSYNAETKVYTISYEYRGTEVGIRGLESAIKTRGLSYRLSHDGPVWAMIVEEPVQEGEIENLDRWEVFTESTEKSLFELPGVVSLAIAYDAARTDQTSPTFKSEVETASDTTYSTSFSAWLLARPLDDRNLVGDLISHLRAGVTGWQLDLIGIRRSRRLEAYLAQQGTYRIGLDDGLLLYMTGELNLPSEIAFALPITPSNISTLFKWRWRKRSQRVERVGQYIEQTVELLFAPWSTLAYADANANLIW